MLQNENEYGNRVRLNFIKVENPLVYLSIKKKIKLKTDLPARASKMPQKCNNRKSLNSSKEIVTKVLTSIRILKI